MAKGLGTAVLLNGLHQHLKATTEPDLEVWLKECFMRAIEISKFDMVKSIRQLETILIVQQAHDAYIFGQLDAAAILCRTALETELTIRYLNKTGLMQEVATGKPLKELKELPPKICDGKERYPAASLTNLIIWAEKVGIIPKDVVPTAWKVHNVGDDYAHAYAMRRVAKNNPTGNLFENTQAVAVYEACLRVISQMP